MPAIPALYNQLPPAESMCPLHWWLDDRVLNLYHGTYIDNLASMQQFGFHTHSRFFTSPSYGMALSYAAFGSYGGIAGSLTDPTDCIVALEPIETRIVLHFAVPRLVLPLISIHNPDAFSRDCYDKSNKLNFYMDNEFSFLPKYIEAYCTGYSQPNIDMFVQKMDSTIAGLCEELPPYAAPPSAAFTQETIQ